MKKLMMTMIAACAAVGANGSERPDCFVEWIGATRSGGQFINTEYVFKTLARVEAYARRTDGTDCDQMGTKSAWFNINYSTSQLWYRYASGTSSATINNISPSVQGRWIDGEWSTKIIHDGEQIGSVNKAFTGNGESFLLFRGRSYSYVRFKSVDLYEGEELLRSFRPAVKDGVVGMWDSVTQKLYPNNGAGSFEQGPRASDVSKLTVVGVPENYGEVTPAYGTNNTFLTLCLLQKSAIISLHHPR